MAIPKKLVARGMPLGDNGFSTATIDLLAASANSQTTYGPGDRILFQIPNYARSFIDFSKSFIKYDIQTRVETVGSVRANDGAPWIERVQIRAGAVSLEDVQSYYAYEKLMRHLKRTNSDLVGNLYGEYALKTDDVLIPTYAKHDVNSGVSKKTRYIKKLWTSVLENDDYLFPVFRLNSGNSLEVELTVSGKEIMLKKLTGTVTGEGFTISNVRFQIHLVKGSDSFIRKFNEMVTNQEELVLPNKVVRRHLSVIPANQADAVIFVNHNTKNLERVYTVFRRHPTSVMDGDQPDLLMGDAAFESSLQSYQYEYMSRQFPESPCEGGTSQNPAEFLANLLVTAGKSLLYDIPNVCQWYHIAFAIGQSFKFSDDDIINGLNTNASGSPITLRLKFNTSLTAPLMVETFAESSVDLVIGPTGGVSLVQRSNMLSE